MSLKMYSIKKKNIFLNQLSPQKNRVPCHSGKRTNGRKQLTIINITIITNIILIDYRHLNWKARQRTQQNRQSYFDKRLNFA